MFGTIRKHSQALWIPIIIVIIVSFVIFFTPDVSIEDFFDGGQGQSSETQEDFNEARTMLLMNISMRNSFENQRLFGQLQQFPPEMRAQYFAQFFRDRLRPEEAGAIASSLGQINLAEDANASIKATIQDLDDYSRLDLLTHVRLEQLKKAEEMGIHVGMDTALKSIANDPRFQREGKFDEKAYTLFIDDTISERTRIIPKGDAGKAIYREFIRQEMVLQRMGELLTASGQFIPDHAVEANWAALNRRYTAQAMFFNNDKHEANATQASTNNVELVKRHYQTMTDRYAVPPKYKVAYVEVDPAPYVAAAKASLDIDQLTKEAIEKHLNSTNTVDHYLDDNGTKLPAGTDLNATAAADILRQNQGNIGRATTSGVIKEAKGFFTSLIKGQDNNTLTAARLKEMASTVNPDGNRTLPYVEAEFEKFGRQLEIGGVALQGATEALAGTSDGKMVLRQFATQDGNATTRVYFIARLGEVGQVTRKWDDLKPAEQQEVRDAFVTAQVAEGVKQDVAELRATISELMEENDITFAEALELDENATAPHIALPPIKLNSLDAETVVPHLDQYATLSGIQNAIRMGGEIEAGWISEYTAADHNRSDGFIVHVSEIAEGERPTKAQLQEEANGVRQQQLGYANPLLREVTTLRHQLYLQQLYDKKARIKKDIEFAEREVESFKAASSTGQDVSKELMEAQESVGRLKQQQSTHLDSEIARMEGLGATVTAPGSSSWRNYAIAALVILLILSFVGGDKKKPKRATATASETADAVDVESESDDDDPKKSDA